MIAGPRPVVSPAQVELYMNEHFQLGRDDVEVRLSRPDDFLLVFHRRIDADRAAPDVVARRNMRAFTVAAWTVHPDLIPEEVVVIVPEKEAPFSPGNLFLRPEELIHSSKGTLHYRVSIEIREVQDWNSRSESSSDGGGDHGRNDEDDDSSQDGFPGMGNDGRSSKPWLRRQRFSPGNDPGGCTWPTARGCDSALGWWGHAAAPSGQMRQEKRRRPVRSVRQQCQGPLPRDKPPRRVWKPRSNSNGNETNTLQKEKESSWGGWQVERPEQVTSPVEPGLAAIVSPSALPEASDPRGATVAVTKPLGWVEAHSGSFEEDWTLMHQEQAVVSPARWDPMRQESWVGQVKDTTEIPVGRAFGRILSAVGPRRSLGPSLESVTFPTHMPMGLEVELDANTRTALEAQETVLSTHVHSPLMAVQLPPSTRGEQERSETGAAGEEDLTRSPPSTRFVTTSCGSPPPGNNSTPLSALEFAALCSQPLPEAVILSFPPRRKPKRKTDDCLLPRRSSRIAKKTRGRVSNPVAAAQNVLMRKLGILKPDAEPDAVAVQQYADLLCNGISPSDSEAIDTLFPEHVPEDEEIDDDEEPIEI
ncbi:unnamed protein product [Urochloa decumbens]|uniref:Uncharacterized protein n=1 Tax=Urochloa decumbens TaxID=240449 RepID=A0ABC9C3G7_9POAL